MMPLALFSSSFLAILIIKSFNTASLIELLFRTAASNPTALTEKYSCHFSGALFSIQKLFHDLPIIYLLAVEFAKLFVEVTGKLWKEVNSSLFDSSETSVKVFKLLVKLLKNPPAVSPFFADSGEVDIDICCDSVKGALYALDSY